MKLSFDLDGTLISVRDKQTLLMRAAAKRHSIGLSVAEYWDLKRAGDGNFSALRKLGMSNDVASQLSLEWLQEIESEVWQRFDQALPETLETLKKLQGAGAYVSIITARKTEYLMRQQLLRLGLASLVNTIHCVSPSNAEIGKATILSRERPDFFIGDSEVDFAAAQLSGTPFVGVWSGQRNAKFLTNLGISNSFPTLPSFINSQILKDF